MIQYSYKRVFLPETFSSLQFRSKVCERFCWKKGKVSGSRYYFSEGKGEWTSIFLPLRGICRIAQNCEMFVLKIWEWRGTNMLRPHTYNHSVHFKQHYLVLASMSIYEFGATKCVTSAMWTPSSKWPLSKVLTESVSSTSSQPFGSMLNTRWVFLKSWRSRSSSGLTFQGFPGVFTGISHICPTRVRYSAVHTPRVS